MRPTFDERLVAAVRAKGPEAKPSAILIEMDGGELKLWGTSLGRVIYGLQRLATRGVLVRTEIADGRGGTRGVYSTGDVPLPPRRRWRNPFSREALATD